MPTASGFWSYVHDDDDASAGRIVQLGRDIVAEYEMQTAEDIDLFLDRDALNWGDAWRARIDASLASVAFFVPVVTPRFFRSAECRRELHAFAAQATALGVRELVMPILYVDVPALRNAETRDDAMELITTFQWEDLTQLRHASSDSTEYREAVARMAARLVRANELADQFTGDVPISGEVDVEGEAGTFDTLATMEATFPEWTQTLVRATDNIADIGAIVAAETARLNAGGPGAKSFAGRLTAMRQLSTAIAEPSAALLSNGQDFSRQLNEVDLGMRILIPQLRNEASTEQDPEALASIDGFYESIRTLDSEASEALQKIGGFIDTLGPIQAMSRDLKKPISEMRAGLTMMLEGQDVIHGWVELIDSSAA